VAKDERRGGKVAECGHSKAADNTGIPDSHVVMVCGGHGTAAPAHLGEARVSEQMGEAGSHGRVNFAVHQHGGRIGGGSHDDWGGMLSNGRLYSGASDQSVPAMMSVLRLWQQMG